MATENSATKIPTFAVEREALSEVRPFAPRPAVGEFLEFPALSGLLPQLPARQPLPQPGPASPSQSVSHLRLVSLALPFSPQLLRGLAPQFSCPERFLPESAP